MKIAFIYEHPNWSDSLIKAFEDYPHELTLINVAELSFDTDPAKLDFDLAINRVNIMPSAERPPQVVFQTLHYLSWLSQSGVRVVNASHSHFVGASKVMQNGIFAGLGLNHPRGIAIYRQADALEAANRIGYPVIVKPNVGGSGAGIGLYQNQQELAEAVNMRALDLGVDRTGLVQEYIKSDGFVYRVEVLGDSLFYSIKQAIVAGSFNYCAADGCSTEEPPQQEEFDFCALSSESGIQVHEPSGEIIEDVVKVVKACGADLGGVEYFIDIKTGKPCYYDFNPYSNFVAQGETLLGFSPERKYIEFVLSLANN